MENNCVINDYQELKKYFTSPRPEYRPVPFYHLDGDISDEDEVSSQLAGFRKSGYGGVALLPVRETLPKFGTEEYMTAYGRILEKCEKLGLRAIYYDDLDFPSGWAGGELAEKHPEALARQLIMREYSCTAGEAVNRKLDTSGVTLSVTAYEVDLHEVLDLRSFVSGDTVCWDPPKGNWDILQFVCKPIENEKRVNLLNYDACSTFIDLTYKRFADNFSEYIGSVVGMTFYDDIQFFAPNRRTWDDGFNEAFAEKFGFDCSPYYPALYRDIGEITAHIKALMFNCRAEMLCQGFFKAVSDFTRAHGLVSTGHVAEPKTIQASWLCGDGMLYQKYAGAAGLDLVHDYVYGLNGCKLASGAADNFDKEIVACEIYGAYSELDRDIMYREAMNVFARGINYLIPHTLWFSGKARIPHEVSHRSAEFRDMLPAFNEFAARAQTLLRGGRHICDIALIYPIYSLQSQTYLYEMPFSGFEFPHTPEMADFMNVINSVMNYSCRDLTVLHPETLAKHCYVEDGELCLTNDVNFEHFKLLLMPCVTMISVKNLRTIAKFFDEGGKIIATGALPSRAFEFSPETPGDPEPRPSFDREVQTLVEHIFGVNTADVNSFVDYYRNVNEAGGAAYFMPSSETAADGTCMVDSVALDSVINSLDIAFDVELTDPPRVANSGVLNLPLPLFRPMKTDHSIRSGGLFNHIHKKIAGCDIYYFANSTNQNYVGRISLLGSFTPEEWNPYTGKIKKTAFEHVTRLGEQYTEIEAEIPSATSVFYVCREYKAHTAFGLSFAD